MALVWVLASAPVVGGLLHLPAGGWWALFGYHTGCVVAARAVGVSWGRRPGVGEMLAWMVLTGAALAIAVWAIPGIAELLPRAQASLSGWGMQGDRALLAFAWYVLVNPWVEEAFWRGALLGPRVAGRIGRTPARVVAAFGFVPYHSVVIHQMFGAEAWWFSGAILLGSVSWTAITVWRRSLYPAVWTHLVADLVIVLAYLASRA